MEREWRECGAITDTHHVSKPSAKVRYKFGKCKYFCKNLQIPTLFDLFRPLPRLSGAGFTPAVSPAAETGGARSEERERERAERTESTQPSEAQASTRERAKKRPNEGHSKREGQASGGTAAGGRGSPTPHHSTNALVARCVAFSREAVGGIPLPYYFTAEATGGSGAQPSAAQAHGFTDVYTAEHVAYRNVNGMHIQMEKGGGRRGNGSTQRRSQPGPRAAHEGQRSGHRKGEPRASKRRGTGQARRREARAHGDRPPLPYYRDDDSYNSLRHCFNVSSSQTTIRAAR